MDPQLFITVTTFLLPVLTAIVCCGLIIPAAVNGTDGTCQNVRVLHRILGVYLIVGAFGWFTLLIYPFSPGLFACVQSFAALSWILTQVIFYHFIFQITRQDTVEKFPWQHYLLPVMFFLAIFVWSLFVPFEVQVDIARTKAEVIPQDYKAYYYMFTSKPPVRFVFSLVYTVLITLRLIRYRRSIGDYSSNEERSSLKWVDILIVLSFGFLMFPLIIFFAGREKAYTVLPGVLSAVIISSQYVILTYNTFKGRYLAPEEIAGSGDTADESSDPCVATITHKPLKTVSRKDFDEYMESHKPYRDPNLRITDLANSLGSNRTYLSSFINNTYGMNFSRYINRQRLAELQRLQSDKDNASLSMARLIEMAGFGSYRNYQRMKDVK